MRSLTPLLPLFLALAACEEVEEPPEAPPANFEECHASDGDETTIEDVNLDGTLLLVDVAYGGGCETHDFVVCWPERSWREESPVSTSLELWHDAHEDGCEAWISETLEFDLQPMIDDYTAAYGASGSFVVDLGSMSVEVVVD